MSEHQGIGDDQLPEDLRPGDDNPLAEGLDHGDTAGDVAPGELLDEGKRPDQWEDGAEGGAQDSAQGGEPAAGAGGGEGSAG